MELLQEALNLAHQNIGSIKGYIQHQFLNNDFFIGIAIPGIVTGFLYIFRSVFFGMWFYIKRAITSEITITTDADEYLDMAEFVFKNVVISFFQRNFVLAKDPYAGPEKKLEIGAGYGTSLGMFKGFPVIITRSIEESDSSTFKERLHLTIIGSRKYAPMKFVERFREYLNTARKGDKTKFYASSSGCWEFQTEKPKRSIDTVILPDAQKKYILEKLERFINSEENYLRKGTPYNIGVLLYGIPGTGKSSLIHAIASHFDRKIMYHKSGSLSNIKNDSILVLEDIDASEIKTERDDKKISKDSFSDVLNFLDGPLTPHGLITIATTNHIENLDPALIRAGRFDVKVELGKMKWEEWNKFCVLMERTNPVSKEDFVDIVPADARYMLTYYTDDDIIKKFKEMKNI